MATTTTTTSPSSSSPPPPRRRLFENTPVDDDIVTAFVKDNAGVELGERVKTSQNVTYKGTLLSDGSPVAVRATVALDSSFRDAEVAFVKAIVASGVPACEPLFHGVHAGSNTIVTVSRWAAGEPVAYAEFRWAKEEALVKAQGRWLGQFHVASKAWTAANPEEAARIQAWDSLHDGLLVGAASERLLAIKSDPDAFGCCHRDCNPSNFFVKGGDVPELDVFDWDQAQRSWFLHDLAQPLWSVNSTKAGLPVAGTPVDVDRDQFRVWIVEAYEEATGTKVDQDVLDDCVELRRSLYERFCRRALAEGDLPPDMAAFVTWVVEAFDSGKL